MMKAKDDTIYPVIMKVPDKAANLPPRDKVKFLSNHARSALDASAKKMDFSFDTLQKNEDGAPMPEQGVYWSLSHKPEYVCAVAAKERIGIDVEKIRPVADRVLEKTADQDEWEIAGGKSLPMFYRIWTAKEAVLKAEGIGLKGLSECKLTRIIDNLNLEMTYQNKIFLLEHFYFEEHLATVVKTKWKIDWVI